MNTLPMRNFALKKKKKKKWNEINPFVFIRLQQIRIIELV